MSLTIIEADASIPQVEDRPLIIAHVTNNFGAWHRGFVLDLSARYPEPERKFRSRGSRYRLGEVQFVQIKAHKGLYVANLYAQRSRVYCVPLSYDALKQALEKLARVAWRINATVQMPCLGMGLGRARWDRVRDLVKETLSDHGVKVIICTRNFPTLEPDPQPPFREN